MLIFCVCYKDNFMKLKYLKIQYAFEEGRDPNRAIKNSIETIVYDIFVTWLHESFIEYYSKKDFIEDKAGVFDFFILEHKDELFHHEPELLQKMLTHKQTMDIMIKMAEEIDLD